MEPKRQSLQISDDKAHDIVHPREKPFIRYQIAKSMGYKLTEKGTQAVQHLGFGEDQWFGERGHSSYVLLMRHDGDDLPQMIPKASCNGDGYVKRWACKDSEDKFAAGDNLIECFNGFHAWWKYEDLKQQMDEDTATEEMNRAFMAGFNQALLKRDWHAQLTSQGFDKAILPSWEDALEPILSPAEREAANIAMSHQDKFGNVHGLDMEVWTDQGIWAEPEPVKQEVASSSTGESHSTEAKPDLFQRFLEKTGVVDPESTDGSHSAEISEAIALDVLTKNTKLEHIIPDGQLQLSDCYGQSCYGFKEATKGCPPMTKTLMQMYMQHGKHSFVYGIGMSAEVMQALLHIQNTYASYSGEECPDDAVLQSATLVDVCMMNVLRWIVLYPKVANSSYDWSKINAHLIRLNVELFNAHGIAQWLDGANIRPNMMYPNKFGWRHSIVKRKWEHCADMRHNTLEKMQLALPGVNAWLDLLRSEGVIAEVCNESNSHGVMMTADGSWVLHDDRAPEVWSAPAGAFQLWKIKWTAPQYPEWTEPVDGEEVTKMFHGTTADALVPMALAGGIAALAGDDSTTASHIEDPCAYFAPAPMHKHNMAREYAIPGRIIERDFLDLDDAQVTEIAEHMSANHAATVRVYLHCTGKGPKVRCSSKAQKKDHEVCFAPGNFTINELWITIGEPKDTGRAVACFTVPQYMTCMQTDEAKEHRMQRKPYYRFKNDSLTLWHPAPWHRWTSAAWCPDKQWAIQYKL